VGQWPTTAEEIESHILSTLVAGGFVGTYLSMSAGSNRKRVTNSTDFHWFEYIGLDET
jgi:hypothetical protein